MIKFDYELDHSLEAMNYLISIDKKIFDADNIAKNPFLINSSYVCKDKKIIGSMAITVLFPPLHYYFVFPAVVLAFFQLWVWSGFVLLLALGIHFFRTNSFFKWVFKKGLRKAGYFGSIKFIRGL